MSSPAEAGSRLEAEQVRLVSALLSGAEPPRAFDVARLRAGAMALKRKRERAVARAWQGLADTLGESFHEQFAAYSARIARPPRGGSLADVRAFARWVAARGTLPEPATLQVLAVDLRYARSTEGLLPRRTPAFRMAFLRGSRCLVVALRWPRLGEHWLRIPLPHPGVR